MSKLSEGVYDQLITRSLSEALLDLPSHLKGQTVALGAQDAIEYLAREVADRVRVILNAERDLTGSGEDIVSIANGLLASMGSGNPAESLLLTSISPSNSQPLRPPLLPLSQSALVTNEQGLNYHAILRSELLSADHVDMICPFIGNQGLNLILDLLQDLGPNLRVITTTYLGGTHVRALERLARTGAKIKIVFESPSQKTALHAKAWLFHRSSGFSTATIGSSNLSPKALVDGLEWNVRVGAKDSPQLLQELVVTFDRLWADPLYESFDPDKDSERVGKELKAQRAGDETTGGFFADLTPLPHQVEMLGELAYSRLAGKHENLIVAATGTGKTLLAAFDYEGLARKWGGRPSLLFVAHREDILKQSAGAFNAVMRDSDFGELNVGRFRAEIWKHVFCSVQSLAARKITEFDPRQFDMIVIDEFHHAEAPTYQAILDYFKPKELLGLTATPERADGRNVIDRFGAPTSELRLWHALERRLLCPFNYFGIDDGTDLSGISWQGGKYQDSDLEAFYVDQGEERAKLVIRELKEKLDDSASMHAIAFCATIRHADFMSDCFRRAGLDAESLHSGHRDERRPDFFIFDPTFDIRPLSVDPTPLKVDWAMGREIHGQTVVCLRRTATEPRSPHYFTDTLPGSLSNGNGSV